MDKLFNPADTFSEVSNAQPEAEREENIQAEACANNGVGETEAIPEADAGDADVTPENMPGEFEPENTGRDSGSETADAAMPMVRAKYNRQVRELSVEDAAPYVEMGLKWEAFKPVHEKLRYLAVSDGRSVEQMIDGLIETAEKGIFDSALSETGGNEAAARKLADYQITDMRRRFEESGAKGTYTDAIAAEDRLMREFTELTNEVPGKFAALTEIPDAVVGTAIEKGISLYDSYLRYEWKQAQLANTERMRQEKAARQSSGALAGGGEPLENQDAAAFSAAFNSVWG